MLDCGSVNDKKKGRNHTARGGNKYQQSLPAALSVGWPSRIMLYNREMQFSDAEGLWKSVAFFHLTAQLLWFAGVGFCNSSQMPHRLCRLWCGELVFPFLSFVVMAMWEVIRTALCIFLGSEVMQQTPLSGCSRASLGQWTLWMRVQNRKHIGPSA